jgi:hypothetical protein
MGGSLLTDKGSTSNAISKYYDAMIFLSNIITLDHRTNLLLRKKTI